MANDIGKINADSADPVPGSPLNNLNGVTPQSSRQRQPKQLHRLPDFNPDLKVEQRVNKARDFWLGTILDIDTFTETDGKKYYEVQLQDGQFVQAYYPDQDSTHEWKDNQRVQVIFNGTDYVIITTPNQNPLHLWWEAKDTLVPGGTCKGILRFYDKDDEEFKDEGSEVEITDTEKRNFVVRGERIQIRLNDLAYEPVGSFGLKRKAKTILRIDANDSSDVTIYSDGAAAKEPQDSPNEHLDQDVKVSAWLNWGHGNKPFEGSKEIFIEYFPDESKWVVVGGEC